MPSNNQSFTFQVTATNNRARAGVFYTPHGEILTPVFAPVGTQASVKALTPAQLQDLGASLILANTYHLYLRPGDNLVAKMGGLHKFMAWEKPLLTDSGGFQVFSLAANRKIDEDGVTFRSHIDGSLHRFTPERSIEIQENLGADIIMTFDECSPPYDRDYNQQALQRTHTWAERCLSAKTRDDQALFGIVQGGVDLDLRKESGEFIASLNFLGHAIGGLSVGETKQEMLSVLELLDQVLPCNKPRYLMGVGLPSDLILGVMRGIDIFDCVLPTRLARHNAALTRFSRLNLVNAVYVDDDEPIEESCTCYTCQHFTRSYIRHLIMAKEILSSTLLSIHNLHVLLSLMSEIRQAILENSFASFTNMYLSQLNNDNNSET